MNRLMLYRELIAIYNENRTKFINTFCEQNAELLNVEEDITYSYHCALNG
jgi:hypothetical protein